MGQGGVVMRLGGMLVCSFVVAIAVVLGSQVVMLGCFLVVMCGLVVCFV
jgi:hypothetical protein